MQILQALELATHHPAYGGHAQACRTSSDDSETSQTKHGEEKTGKEGVEKTSLLKSELEYFFARSDGRPTLNSGNRSKALSRNLSG